MIYLIFFVLLGCSFYKGLSFNNKFVISVDKEKAIEFVKQDEEGKDVRMVVNEKEVTFFTADGDISVAINKEQRLKILESMEE